MVVNQTVELVKLWGAYEAKHPVRVSRTFAGTSWRKVPSSKVMTNQKANCAPI
jgi:hypothetical protein